MITCCSTAVALQSLHPAVLLLWPSSPFILLLYCCGPPVPSSCCYTAVALQSLQSLHPAVLLMWPFSLFILLFHCCGPPVPSSCCGPPVPSSWGRACLGIQFSSGPPPRALYRLLSVLRSECGPERGLEHWLL